MQMSSPWIPDIPSHLEHLPDRIASSLKDKHIFMTGASGFIGKVLLEKILRTCENVKIYILLRPKKNKNSRERLEEIFQSPLYEALKKEQSESAIFEKVIPINGDVAVPDLGISAEDRQMLSETIHIVYHIAATVRTRDMLNLSKQMIHLQLFVYVSTAYCHPKEKVLEEKTYPPPVSPHNVIEKAELLSKNELELLKQELLQDFPNGYAYTKCLCEGVVTEYMEAGMPCMILRPSIIIPIWKDPLPGWTDNINGPTGLLIGAGKGIIRTMYCDYSTCADFLPVDVLVNGVLLSTWNFLSNPGNTMRVINLTANKDFQITWYDIIENGKDIARNKVPLNNVLWYPGGAMTNSKLWFFISSFFFHTIPSYILDTLISLGGYEPVLKRVHNRIKKGFDIFEYYTKNSWSFKNENLHALRNMMNEKEAIRYEIAMFRDLDEAKAYFEMCIHGARQYLLGEPPETLPGAKRHVRIMYYVHVITQVLLLGFFLWVLSKFFL
ncbi:hypothetical protein M8J76_010337 [Diaphorina citri]|nr:hypothetical protein M8J75_013699 [Diaphorina citri]KAI5745351.1 hypothetical protein M8J76_010337 [Diaphorina citri]